jgi:hypothetical protein
MHKKRSKMRTWDKIDIVDVLTKHYYELRDASAELSEGGDHQGSDEIDDSCIAIEIFLEEERSLIWDGVEFIKSEEVENTTSFVSKTRNL